MGDIGRLLSHVRDVPHAVITEIPAIPEIRAARRNDHSVRPGHAPGIKLRDFIDAVVEVGMMRQSTGVIVAVHDEGRQDLFGLYRTWIIGIVVDSVAIHIPGLHRHPQRVV